MEQLSLNPLAAIPMADLRDISFDQSWIRAAEQKSLKMLISIPNWAKFYPCPVWDAQWKDLMVPTGIKYTESLICSISVFVCICI